MKVLVTGGAGFIGSHLIDVLVQRDHQVVVVDNLSTGRPENVDPATTFYQADICSSELDRIFEKERPEVVNHHAAQTVIQRSTEDPVFDAEQNILGSLNLVLQSVYGLESRRLYMRPLRAYTASPNISLWMRVIR